MLRACALLIALLTLLPAADARAQGADPWLGPDKALHFAASAGIAGSGYALTACFSGETWPRLAVGGGLALAAGVGKELYDLTGRGTPSWKDLTWDLFGTATGLGIAWAIDRLLDRRATAPEPAPAQSVLLPVGDPPAGQRVTFRWAWTPAAR